MNKVAILLVFAMLCVTISASVLPKVETISGTLTIVNSDEKTIYVTTGEKMTYDFKISPATKIAAGDRQLKFADLAGQIGKQIEVVFRPLRTGNAAIAVEFK